MQFHFGSVLAFVLVACVFLLVTLLVGRLVRPATPDAAKATVYECGERPIGGGWFNFNPRFYVIALAFLIFDVEVAFTYPVAAVFRRWLSAGEGGRALVEIGAFVLILALGLAYVWRQGDLDWVRAEAEAPVGDAVEAPVAGGPAGAAQDGRAGL
jgi:NADH-quinone oxidoreductase subunit A